MAVIPPTKKTALTNLA